MEVCALIMTKSDIINVNSFIAYRKKSFASNLLTNVTKCNKYLISFSLYQRIRMKRRRLFAFVNTAKYSRIACLPSPQPWRFPKKWSRIQCGLTIGRKIRRVQVACYANKYSGTLTTWTSQSSFIVSRAADQEVHKTRPYTMWLTFEGIIVVVVDKRFAINVQQIDSQFPSMGGIQASECVITVGTRRIREFGSLQVFKLYSILLHILSYLVGFEWRIKSLEAFPYLAKKLCPIFKFCSIVFISFREKLATLFYCFMEEKKFNVFTTKS